MGRLRLSRDSHYRASSCRAISDGCLQQSTLKENFSMWQVETSRIHVLTPADVVLPKSVLTAIYTEEKLLYVAG